MGEDASLDDFLDGGEERESDGGEAAEDAVSEPETDDDERSEAGDATAAASPERETVEPAVTTYAWSPEGAACADCGEVVERRWEQDGQLVCGACKAW